MIPVGSLLHKARAVMGLLSVATPAAVAAHCAGYELAFRLETVLGPLGGAGHHAGHGAAATSAAAASDPHAHHVPLIPLTTGALLVGALVVLTGVVTARRFGRGPALRLGPLLLTQAAVLAAIEAPMLFSDGAASPSAVVLGLALQLPVALVILALARGARRLLATLAAASGPVLTAAAGVVVVPRPATRRQQSIWASAAVGRAPPVGVITHPRRRFLAVG